MAQIGTIRLSAGEQTVSATAPERALRSFVAAANAARSIGGLPDALNPQILDPEKVIHLAAALPRLPQAVLARLSGHDLVLDDPDLQVHAAFPSPAGRFDAPFGLEITDVQGRYVMARIDATPDPALARDRARDAKAAYDRLAAEVTRIEQAGPGQDGGLRLARERRQAVARLWRMTARAWAQSDGSAEAMKAADDADKATRAAAIPPRGGTVP